MNTRAFGLTGKHTFTLADVMAAQARLKEQNVAPPFFFRATPDVIGDLLAASDVQTLLCAVAANERPKLAHGEVLIGRVSETFLVQVPGPGSWLDE